MNTTSISPDKIPLVRKVIIALSIVIPVVVAVLFRVKIDGVDLSFLPPIYASINGVTAVLLFSALWAIKSGNIALHQRLIQMCLGLSLVFLGCYVAYHMTSDPTLFGDSNGNGTVEENENAVLGLVKYLYYFLLISHILLSIVVIPIVLFTYLFAWQGDYIRHKKWTKIAFPVWFYVATTGVIVYLMISPYYA
jgi:putative membrane protein